MNDRYLFALVLRWFSVLLISVNEVKCHFLRCYHHLHNSSSLSKVAMHQSSDLAWDPFRQHFFSFKSFKAVSTRDHHSGELISQLQGQYGRVLPVGVSGHNHAPSIQAAPSTGTLDTVFRKHKILFWDLQPRVRALQFLTC